MPIINTKAEEHYNKLVNQVSEYFDKGVIRFELHDVCQDLISIPGHHIHYEDESKLKTSTKEVNYLINQRIINKLVYIIEPDNNDVDKCFLSAEHVEKLANVDTWGA